MSVDRHAVKVWADAATDLLRDAQSNLKPEEWLALLEVVTRLIARYGAADAGNAEPLDRPLLDVPALTVVFPLEAGPRIQWRCDSRAKKAQVNDWIRSHPKWDELVIDGLIAERDYMEDARRKA